MRKDTGNVSGSMTCKSNPSSPPLSSNNFISGNELDEEDHCPKSVSVDTDQAKTKQRRLPIPTKCPHCNGSLKEDMENDTLLTSILAGQVHTALTTTIFLANQALPPQCRYKMPFVVIRALFWFARTKNPKDYDEAIVARIEIPKDLWGGQVVIAEDYDTRHEDVYKREKFLRTAWVRLHIRYLDKNLKRAGKHEHQKALRTAVDFLPNIF